MTTLSDNEPVPRAIMYMVYLSTHRPANDPSCTILKYETGVFFEDPRLEIVDWIGFRYGVLTSKGFVSTRNTAILDFIEISDKLPLLVV